MALSPGQISQTRWACGKRGWNAREVKIIFDVKS